MQTIITGCAYVLGDNIDTDQIIPAQYLSFNPSLPFAVFFPGLPVFFPGLVGEISGRIFVRFGTFSNSNYLVALNYDGTVDASFVPAEFESQNWGGPIEIFPHGNGLLLVGNLRMVNQIRRLGVARILLNPIPRAGFGLSVYHQLIESAESADVNVLRFGDTSEPVSLRYRTADGSAQANLNYSSTSGTISFARGETIYYLSHAYNAVLDCSVSLPALGLPRNS